MDTIMKHFATVAAPSARGSRTSHRVPAAASSVDFEPPGFEGDCRDDDVTAFGLTRSGLESRASDDGGVGGCGIPTPDARHPGHGQQHPQPNAVASGANGIVDPLAPASAKLPMSRTQYHPPAPAPAPGMVYSQGPQGVPTGMSPTGVADMSLLPSWVDAKNPPMWYNEGGDVDALLEDADCLNWLNDTGDLEETYPPALSEPAAVVSSSNSSGTGVAQWTQVGDADGAPASSLMEPAIMEATADAAGGVVHPSAESLSFLVDPPSRQSSLREPTVAEAAQQAVMNAMANAPEEIEHLPSFLEEEAMHAAVHIARTPPPPQAHNAQIMVTDIANQATAELDSLHYSSATEAVESDAVPPTRGESGPDLMGFPDLDMGDEQAFVSALLETSGQGGSVSFPKLQSDLGMSQGALGHITEGGVLAGEEGILEEP